MQLWKKNFLVTFFLFLLVINGSLLVLHTFLFRSELSQWMSRTISGERSVLKLVSSYQKNGDDNLNENIKDIVEKYVVSGIKIRVEMNSREIVNFMPSTVKGEERVQIIKYRGVPYVLINDSQLWDDDAVNITYMESMESFYYDQSRRTWIMVLAGILLSSIIGGMLYLTMKSINRPVSQIAHELRTPLTGIQGYAEYLMMGNIEEEDRFFAAQQIVESALHLGNIVERLLIIGGMREGKVQMQKVDLHSILEDIQKSYPEIYVDCQLDSVYGDKTLIRCMLDNLIHNAVNNGNSIKVSADDRQIIIWNDGEIIEEKKLKQMNHPQRGFAPEYADRHGFGIGLCHEIAGVHGWKLGYKSSAEEGTITEILL